LVAAAIAACYPMLFLSEATLMAEALYAPLVTLMLLLAYRAYDRPSAGRFAALGAAIGLATLARAEGFLLGIVVVVPLVLLVRTLATPARLARAGIAIGVGVLVCAPWTIRNAVRFHAFVPVSNNVATLADGANCGATYHGRLLGLWRESFSEVGNVARNLPQAQACFEGFDIADPHFDEAKVARISARRGLRPPPPRFAPPRHAVRVLRTWGVAPDQQIDFETLEGRPRFWQAAGTAMLWLMLPLAVAGALVLRRRRVLLWPLLAPVVTVTFVAAATYGQQRFRVAAEPPIIVLAAVSIVTVLGGLRRRASAAS
jgi:4-amino-4-deoxy-L-arabinose transferase-like glycosyltransferase